MLQLLVTVQCQSLHSVVQAVCLSVSDSLLLKDWDMISLHEFVTGSRLATWAAMAVISLFFSSHKAFWISPAQIPRIYSRTSAEAQGLLAKAFNSLQG